MCFTSIRSVVVRRTLVIIQVKHIWKASRVSQQTSWPFLKIHHSGFLSFFPLPLVCFLSPPLPFACPLPFSLHLASTRTHAYLHPPFPRPSSFYLPLCLVLHCPPFNHPVPSSPHSFTVSAAAPLFHLLSAPSPRTCTMSQK